MKTTLALACLMATPALADEAAGLCATNPAYARPIMLAIVQAQLQRDHDPGLDSDSPDKLADQAVAQGIGECVTDMRTDRSLAPALAGLSHADAQVGWDAYNTACADHKASKGACITSEIGSAKALKRLMGSDARTLVQACALVLQADPAMTEWRQCVDISLAVHAAPAKAQSCKLSANWHVAKTGAAAGAVLAACLR